MADEFEIDDEFLINCIKVRPVLWDKTLDVFKLRNATRQAWNDICLLLRNDFDDLEEIRKEDFCRKVMKRWKHIRDAFLKSEKRYKESKASGSKKKKYIHSKELQFLRKIYEEGEIEGYENGDEDNSIEELIVPVSPVPLTVTTVEGTPKNVVSIARPCSTQHKKMDEIDLKILRALNKKESEKINDRLQKIYDEREAEESSNNAVEDNDTEELIVAVSPAHLTLSTVEGTAEKVVSKAKPSSTQNETMDEIDLKILHALNKRESEKKNNKLLFFESLLPFVDKFDDNRWLQCQIEILQVISKIKNAYPSIPQTHYKYNQPTSFQSPLYYPPFNHPSKF